MFSRLADRFVLVPTRGPIRADHKSRRIVPGGGGQIEVWIERTSGRGQPAIDLAGGPSRTDQPPVDSCPEPRIFVLKFNGAGGRAERTSVHPLDFWSDLPGEVWSPNPPGYGGSEGRPRLTALVPAGRAVFEELRRVADGRPIVVTGNSLGTTIALRLAAEFAGVPNFAGLVLRNPPPLSQLIWRKFGWRTLGLSLGVARQIPPELDSVANASRSLLPSVFLCAGCDRVVPPKFQQLIVTSYAGPKQVVCIPDADHVFVLAEPQLTQYGAALSWLRQQWER